MVQLIMQSGIGLLVGCVLMLAFFPLIRQRAVRSTKRELTAATPLTTSALQADKDQLRAEFAMSVRRLEIGVEKMRERAMARLGPADKRAADMSRLQAELDKKTALIGTLRAQNEVRKKVAKRIVKLLMYVFARMRRRQRPIVSATPVFKFEQGPQWEYKRPALQSGPAKQLPQGEPAKQLGQSEPAKQRAQSEPARRQAQSDLAATAAAIAAVNLKRRRAISKV